jgi:uncharacterized protein (UPF0332 family)
VSEEASQLWLRAKDSLAAAEALLELSPDSCASRAYYVAFYAVSALFAQEGRTFRKHASLETALHKDLVYAGRWPEELGKEYSHLFVLRMTGDYGGGKHVSPDEARQAVEQAKHILHAVAKLHPELNKS